MLWRIILISVLYLAPSVLASQEYTLILDTVYTRAKTALGSTVMYLSKGDTITFFSRNNYRTYDKVEAIVDPHGILDHDISNILINKNGKSYTIDSTLQLKKFTAGKLDLKDIPPDGIKHLSKKGESVAYLYEGKTFFKHISWKKPRIVHDGGWPDLFNQNHLIIGIEDEGGFGRNDHYYLMSKDKLLPLPNDSYHVAGTDSLIHANKCCQDFGFNPGVFNINMKPIVDFDSGFSDYDGIEGELIILINRKQNFCLLLKSPSDIVRLENTKDVSSTFDPNILIATANDGDNYFINTKGKKLNNLVFSKLTDSYHEKIFTGRQGKMHFIISKNLEVIFSGPYDYISMITPNRFIVRRGSEVAVIDSIHREILPFKPDYEPHVPSTLSRRNVFGRTLFFRDAMPKQRAFMSKVNKDSIEVYSLDGEMLLAWNRKNEENFVDLNWPTGWDIGLNAISRAEKSKVLKMNPSNAWQISRKTGKRKEYRLIRNTGTPITPWCSRIFNTSNPKRFVIRTKSGKYGLIEV